MNFGSDDLTFLIAPVLKRLYPQNPDIVLGREARIIADALLPLIQAETACPYVRHSDEGMAYCSLAATT